MSSRSSMEAGLAALYAAIGLAALWNGVAVTVLATVGPDGSGTPEGRSGRRDVAYVRVRRSEVAAPDYRDAVSVDGLDYTVQGVERRTWYDTHVRLERDRRKVAEYDRY